MFNRGEVKYQARQQLKGEYWPALLATLITFFFASSFPLENGIPFTAYDLSLFLLNLMFDLSEREMLTFVLLLVSSTFIGSPLLVGRARYFLSAAQTQWCLGDLLYPFKTKKYWTIVATMLVYGLILLASFLIPLGIGFFFATAATNFRGTMIFFGLIASAISLYFIYNYRFIPYILASDAKVKTREALEQSRYLVHEKKVMLFFFDFSFLGWYIIGSIFFGVGIFLVIPYHLAATARLYLELTKKKEDAPEKRTYPLEDSITEKDNMTGEDNRTEEDNKTEEDNNAEEKNKAEEGKSTLLCKSGIILLLIILILGLNKGFSPMVVNAQENVIFIGDYAALLEEVEAGASSIVVDDDIFLENPITITHDITFTGTGTLYVVGDFWHFIVEPGATLTIDGGLTLYGGGGLVTQDNPNGSLGGGIFVNGGTFILSKGKLLSINPFLFIDDDNREQLLGAITVSSGGQFYMNDGLISNSDGHGVLVLEGSLFTMDGGEISNSNARGVVIKEDGEFVLNDGSIANNNGGLLIQNEGVAHIYGGVIEQNGGDEVKRHLPGLLSHHHTVNLTGRGGGIRMDDTDTVLNLHGGVFSRNTAYEGGGIFSHGTINMFGGTITNNMVTHRGGGIHSSGTLNMHGGEITHNLAYSDRRGGGGGIFVRGRFNLFEGTISHNKAGHSGAGIFVNQGQIRIHGGEIVYNQPVSEEGWFRGGGITLNNYGSLHMVGGTIRANAASSGGGINIERSSAVVIHGGGIIENHAHNGGGGGIILSDFDTYLAITGGVISGNIASGSGGAISTGWSIINTAITITGGELTYNTAYHHGGAIYVERNHMLIIGPEVIFRGNIASNNHNIGLVAGRERYPSLMWYGDNSLPGTHLLNNYDVNYEGRWQPSTWQLHLIIVSLTMVLMAVSGLIFHRKKRKSLLTALALLLFFICLPATYASAEEQVVVTDENSLREAIAGSSATIIVDNVILLGDVIEIDSPVTLSGSGALKVSDNHRHFHILEDGKLILEGTLTLTRADGYTGVGGGVRVEGVLEMNGGEISGNYAEAWPTTGDQDFGMKSSGGGVSVHLSGTFSMNDGSIRNNVAASGGGVNVGGSFFMNGGSIVDNVAYRGGGVFLWFGEFHLNDGVIGYNRAYWFGGGVAIIEDYVTMTMNGGEITLNHADDLGGGIYSHGGLLGLFGGGSSIRIVDGTITDNSAGIMGGGLHLALTHVRLEGGEIINNQASGHGGIYSCFFVENTLYTGANVIISNNSPINAHEQPEPVSLHTRIITPDAFRFVFLVVVAVVGTFHTIKRRKIMSHTIAEN